MNRFFLKSSRDKKVFKPVKVVSIEETLLQILTFFRLHSSEVDHIKVYLLAYEASESGSPKADFLQSRLLQSLDLPPEPKSLEMIFRAKV